MYKIIIGFVAIVIAIVLVACDIPPHQDTVSNGRFTAEEMIFFQRAYILIKDNKTGKEYLSVGSGGITELNK